MFKKFISIITVFAVLLAFTPVAAADTVPATPTIESILDEYQEKAFAAQVSGDTAATAAYSPRSGNAPLTLEQETVNELTAAGYEAYNVTDDNYDAVEEALNTDLASLGITVDSSYILVFSGEDASTKSRSGDDPLLPPHVNDDGMPGSSFTYLYNGNLYTMRYATVVASDLPSELYVIADYMMSTIPNLDDYGSFLWDCILAIGSQVGENIPLIGAIAAISDLASLIGEGIDLFVPDSLVPMDPGTLVLRSGTAWTRSYIQVYDSYSARWITTQCSSYAVSRAHFDASYVLDPVTNEPVQIGGVSQRITTYSPFYNDTAQRKSRAMLGYISQDVLFDGTGDIPFYFVGPDGEVNFGMGSDPLFVHEESRAYITP